MVTKVINYSDPSSLTWGDEEQVWGHDHRNIIQIHQIFLTIHNFLQKGEQHLKKNPTKFSLKRHVWKEISFEHRKEEISMRGYFALFIGEILDSKKQITKVWAKISSQLSIDLLLTFKWPSNSPVRIPNARLAALETAGLRLESDSSSREVLKTEIMWPYHVTIESCDENHVTRNL